ncbi:glycosyltransferase family 2 protein [Limosilactobacillus caecicola]|uniref:glycosyltransferase family 2 protein n=1 Tax=Limosilactobacillus caecicola TaxID=2941332 RepID=UPI00203E21FE|nr:glycosyltransferase family 2 protein [Limosilactobacillus caecicola]
MVDETPKVSMIVPVYNCLKYLKDCLDSILKQTYHNLEIILVDDGSTDGSLKICVEYAHQDSRIRVFHQDNQGVSVARNNGISHATGEYLCFVDGDDKVSENYCEHLVSLIEDGNADIAMTSYLLLINDKYYVNQTPNPEDESLNGIYHPATWLAACHDYFDVFTPVVMWGKLFRRKLFEHAHFADQLTMAEDAAMIWQLYLKASRLVFNNQTDYIYRRRQGSAVDSQNPAPYQKRIAEEQFSLFQLIRFDPEDLVADYRSYLQGSMQTTNFHLSKNAELLSAIIQKNS